MAKYRMYIVERSGKFRWPYDLFVQGDDDALSMARAAHYACSDMPVAVEVWHGARRIPGTSHIRIASRDQWERACSAQPEALLKLTEALRNSGTSIARSRRLSQQVDALRSRQSAA